MKESQKEGLNTERTKPIKKKELLFYPDGFGTE